MPYRPPGETVPVPYEVQHIRQVWVWILIAFIAALCWYFFIVQIGSGERVGTNPAPDWVVLIISIVFGIIFPLWFLVMRLEYIVTDTDFAFRFSSPAPALEDTPL